MTQRKTVSVEELDALHTQAARYAFAQLSPAKRAAMLKEFCFTLHAHGLNVFPAMTALERRERPLLASSHVAKTEVLVDAHRAIKHARADAVPAYERRVEAWLNRHHRTAPSLLELSPEFGDLFDSI